ncbi:MobF family relaxase [Nevskia sp.]|uniref:MobF family relaxase n=1 Tax=Nevskia sp. TaxID=1929292 RepID=UPI003F71CDED
MMSIGKITDAGVAVAYYEKDDYYSAGGADPDAQGEWYGEGAARLGLAGAVDRDAFKSLLEGHLPDGQQLGTVREAGGPVEHRPGYDLTFSAPKSVTLIAELGGDKAVIEAHQRAVRSALGWVESNVAATRVKSSGEIHRENTGNLVIATFQHDTNRNHDPQLHTHSVVINATQRDDGKWRSLDGKAFFESQSASTAVYRSALALELQRLGYQLETEGRDGSFEIAGVSAEAIAEFSTRRAEIKASLKDRGLGPEASDQAALMTRHAKTVEDRAALGKEWDARAAAIGFDPQSVIAQARERGDQTNPLSAAEARKALQSAITRLSDQEAAFTHSNLLAWTLAGAVGRLSVADAEKLIAAEKSAGRLHDAQLGPQRGYVTLSSLQQEERIQASLVSGRNAVSAAYSADEASRLLASLPERRQREADAARNEALWRGDSAEAVAAIRSGTLNEGQAQAVQMILSSQDRIVGVLGRPGTGKTYMLGEARQLLAEKGLNMVGMAMNAEAARQLGSSAGIESHTISRHLKTLGEDAARLRSADPARAAEIRSAYAKQVWVVDEASQVNNQKMRGLTTLAEKLGARLVLVGDPDQLGAIQAGKPFARMLANGMQHREMYEIRRQTDPRHVSAIRDVLAKDFGSAMEKLAPETREIADRSDRLRAMVSAWSASGDARDSTLMLSARNQTRTELNEMARDVLRSEGKLVGEQPARQLQSVYAQRADTALASTYRPGQTVQFPRALKSLGVDAGAYARVESVNARDGIVYLDVGGRRVPWAPGLVAGGAKMPPSIFVERETTLAPGERITWSKNDPSLGLTNGQRLNVIATDAQRMTVQTEDGRRVEIDRGVQSGRHWEHGYATTIYKSQGQTAAQVLVDAASSDKSLLSQKAFLVAVSRQTEGLTLYTDSAEKLRDSVAERSGDKLSAIDSRISVSDVTDRAILAAFRESDTRRDAERAAAAAARELRAAAPEFKRPAPSRGLDLER